MSTVPPGGERPGGWAGEPRGPTALRMILGSQLRRFRENAGVTPDQAGYAIRASRSKISRLENGRVGVKGRDVTDLLALYGVRDEAVRAAMVALARQASTPGWWAKYTDLLPEWFESYLGMEGAAAVIRTFECQFVNGLFQTEAYARAVTLLGHQGAPAWDIARRVSLRLRRQQVLAGPDPPRVWSVMDEAALRRPVGGPAVMRAQLEHLAAAAARPRVTLQVVPFASGGHAAAGGSFTVLRFAEPELPDIVYLEQLTSALYLDDRADVEHYLEVLNAVSTQALTPEHSARFLTQIIREL
jgi:hypothetical protein